MTAETTITTPAPAWAAAPKPANDPPGAGTLHLAGPGRARFAVQRASYPLKFLAPLPLPAGQPPHVGVAYCIAYGGGLVAGDHVRVDATVDPSCTLVLLTQGSTKVYKHRPGMRPHAHRLRYEASGTEFGLTGTEAPLTRQRMRVRVGAGGLLLLLPDSVSPFRDSRYMQAQRVELAEGASALVLDWVNSGRGQRPPMPTRVTARGRWRKRGDETHGAAVPHPRDSSTESTPSPRAHDDGGETPESETGVADTEVWAMSYYASANEIVLPSPTGAPRVVARERMVLDNTTHDTATQTAARLSPVAARLAPYHVYATVLLYGPQLADVRDVLAGMADAASQFQVPRPPGLLWSYSPLSEEGGILRLAGVEVEDVRGWMRAVLEAGGLMELVGEGLWPRCL